MTHKRRRIPPLKAQNALWGVLLLLVAIPAATNPAFRSIINLQGIAESSSILIVIAMGQAVIILMAGVDLSVGAIMALGSVLLAVFMGGHWPFVLAMGVMLAVAAMLGVLNGIGVALLRIPSFIMTFGMMGLAGGIALVVSRGTPVPLPGTASLSSLVYGTFMGIPEDFWMAILLLLLLSAVMKFLPWGRHVYAVGSNRQAARLSGVRVERTIIVGFAVAALFAGLASVIYAARTVSGNPIGGANLNLDSIAAAVIGGTSLLGGRGQIWGAFLGAVIYSLIINVLTVYGINPNMAELVSGIVIIAAAYTGILGQKGGQTGDS